MLISEIMVGPRVRRDMGDLDALAASIADVGLLQPIVVKPDGTLVAGQRRLEACKRLGWDDVPVHVVCTASDALKALKAERDENTCRKDFTPSEAVAVAEGIEPLERQAARERLAVRSEKFSEVNAKGNALDFTAAAVGMSRPTLQKAREVVAAAEREPERYEPIREQMDRTGKVDGAYKELRRAMRQETQKAPPLPTAKYRVVYADPPWEYGQIIEKYGPAERHYSTMSLDEICAMGLKVADMTEPDAVLFLWSTSPKLRDAFAVMDAWGFRYSGAMFVWDKVGHNYGHYNSVRHELLLIGIKGSCLPDSSKLTDSVQTIQKGEHSEKPKEFRQIIDEMYPFGCSPPIAGGQQ